MPQRRPQKRKIAGISRRESSFTNGRNEERARLPRPVRHERGEGRGEGCPANARRLAGVERLLSPALSYVPNGGEGDGGDGGYCANFCKD